MSVIFRVAGTGDQGNSGDDGPATAASLNTPEGVAVTPDHGFLIVDTNNNEVRKVSSDGVITRVAGTGSAGHGGDNGPATDAQLNAPVEVAVTPDGGFLIDAPMVVKAFFGREFGQVRQLVVDGQDRDGPLLAEGRLLSGHESQQLREMGAGAAGGSFEGQHVCGSRLAGQAAPGAWRQPRR